MHGSSSASGVPVLEPAAPPVRSVALVERLEGTCRELRRFRLRRCLLQTSLAVLALAGLLAVADWLWVLGAGVRAAGLLAVAGVAVGLLVRGHLRAGRPPARHDAAAEVEAGFPELGQRVRTTLEYVEPTPQTTPARPGLVRALAADTERRTTGLDFGRLVPWGSLRWLRAGLAVLALAYLVSLATAPGLRTAALRLFLLPAAYTHLTVEPGDQALRVGSDFTVHATVSGRPVKGAWLQHRPAGGDGEWTAVSLAPDDRAKVAGELETTLKECQEDLEYRVVAGPVESPVYRLTILRPLVLQGVEARVEPPAYTRKEPEVVRQGDLKVPEGSAVRFRFTLDRPPQAARLLLSRPAGQERPAEAVPPAELRVEGTTLAGELHELRADVVYEVAAEAADGMRLEGARFRIAVVPDRGPTVRFVKPPEQLEVTPTTEVPFRVEAADDYGVARAGIVFQVGNGPKHTLSLKDFADRPAAAVAEAVLALEEHAVTFQDGVSYYAFAEDNYPGTPHRAVTELRFIDVRPYKRAYQLLKTGGS